MDTLTLTETKLNNDEQPEEMTDEQVAEYIEKIQGTWVLDENMDSEYRITVNEGGSRSSKTYSLAQMVILKCFKEKGILFSITRKTFPALRASVMKDFFDILNTLGIYHPNNHDKSQHIYRLNGSEVEFFSVDQPQKIRGRKRDYCWINEANELNIEDFRQLELRTTKQIYMDYNPSDMFSWIYDAVLPRPDARVIKSTYKDNPFLEKEVIQTIERYKEADPNFWRIYGLGERGISETTIYTHWQFCDELPENAPKTFGLDFGFNHPTVLSEHRETEAGNYIHEWIYKSGMTTQDLINQLDVLVAEGKLTKQDYIYADPEDPKAIEEIKRAGYNIKMADKGAGSVRAGINLIKSKPLFITKASVNGLKEIKSYSWKEKDGKPIDEVVKVNDDFMDSFRYAIYSNHKKVVPRFR